MTLKAALRTALLLACGLHLLAQVSVMSDLQRVDPFGETVEEVRQDSRREILSPAIPRNATSSFQILIELPAGKFYYLYVGMNPEDAVTVKVYKEVFAHQSNGRWIPDQLKEVELPYLGSVGSQGIPGQKVEVYWLDITVPKDAPIRRIKVDPQVFFENHWISYPMEVRVVAAQVQGDLPAPGEPAPIQFPVDATAQTVWRSEICAKGEKNRVSGPLSIRQLVERNARQDTALRGRLTAEDVARLLGVKDARTLCEAYAPNPAGPEVYLRLRDRVLRSSEK
jgi:hypothetical protein